MHPSTPSCGQRRETDFSPQSSAMERAHGFWVPRGQTVLHDAAMAGAAELAAELIRFGADADAKEPEGHTPLYYASTGAVARVLLSAGASVDVTSGPTRPGDPAASSRASRLRSGSCRIARSWCQHRGTRRQGANAVSPRRQLPAAPRRPASHTAWRQSPRRGQPPSDTARCGSHHRDQAGLSRDLNRAGIGNQAIRQRMVFDAHHHVGDSVGYQLPMPLGDDFDGVVGHFHGGLIANRADYGRFLRRLRTPPCSPSLPFPSSRGHRGPGRPGWSPTQVPN